MKKILALALALVMLLSVCSFAAAEAEPVKLVWFIFCDSVAPVDWPEVEEVLNAYSAEKIGVTCEYKYMDSTQIALATQTGEYFDIAFTCDWYNDYATNVAAGMFRDLTDDLANYPALRDTVVDLAWEGAKINNRIYAIPHMKDIGYEVFWILDSKYFLEEKGFEQDPYISFEGIEKYLEAYKTDYPDDYPIKENKSGITSWKNCLVDYLNMDYLIGLDWEAQGTDDEYTVKSALEIPAFVNRLKTIHSWYEKGYINPDAAVTESLTRPTKGVVQSGQGWFGAETVWANAIKKPVYISRYDGAYLSTSSIRGSMTAVSAFSDHPQEALKLIELMNTDAWYRETARYGIEGKHYVTREGSHIVDYPEGVDAGSVGYGHTIGTYGDQTDAYFRAPLTDEFVDNLYLWGEDNAKVSRFMGYNFDTSNVSSEITAVIAEIGKYGPALNVGTVDPEDMLPKFLDALEAAGINKIIEENQRQLDEWLATQE